MSVALLALAAGPSVAAAGTASVSGSQVSFVASPGETNNTQISTRFSSVYGDWETEVGDLSALDVAAGVGCTQELGDALCITATPPTVSIALGDGDDMVDYSAPAAAIAHTLDGGPGNDTLWAESPGGSGTFAGGDGNDVFWPDNGGIADEVNPPAADDISGGPGTDEMRYSWHLGVSASIDDAPGDGAPGESDNIHTDVEILHGSWKDDHLVGSAAANELNGREGDDVLAGGGGADKLYGVDGADRLSGDEGADYLEGDAGDDLLDGGQGLDSFIGDDTFYALTGNDTIRARDGVAAEPISCGPGSDVAEIDGDDQLADDGLNTCESVARGPASGPKIKSGSLRLKRGAIKVKLACPSGAAACRGQIAIKAKSATVAKGRYKVPAGKKNAAAAKPTKAGRALLKRQDEVKVTVELAPKGGGETVRKELELRG
jgi:Ca2+-binding RTX toxin-like protein